MTSIMIAGILILVVSLVRSLAVRMEDRDSSLATALWGGLLILASVSHSHLGNHSFWLLAIPLAWLMLLAAWRFHEKELHADNSATSDQHTPVLGINKPLTNAQDYVRMSETCLADPISQES